LSGQLLFRYLITVLIYGSKFLGHFHGKPVDHCLIEIINRRRDADISFGHSIQISDGRNIDSKAFATSTASIFDGDHTLQLIEFGRRWQDRVAIKRDLPDIDQNGWITGVVTRWYQLRNSKLNVCGDLGSNS
jgi:hypothetical protein